MGSVNTGISGVYVVDKYATANLGFIKHSRRIKRNAADSDTAHTVLVDAVTRPIGSGSVVRDNGVVEYLEEKVVGMTLPGRQVNERIASGFEADRTLSVDTNDNETLAVIETSLQPDVPQEGAKHTGNRVVRSNTVDDELTDRVSND